MKHHATRDFGHQFDLAELARENARMYEQKRRRRNRKIATLCVAAAFVIWRWMVR